MGTGSDDERGSIDEARRSALREARRCLAEAEALVLSGQPGGPAALEHAREALALSSSFPPAASAEEEQERAEADAKQNLRDRFSAFLKGLH